MAIMAQTIKPVSFSQTWTFFEGDWHDGNVPIMGPRTHGAWLGSTVFDGARAINVAGRCLILRNTAGNI